MTFYSILKMKCCLLYLGMVFGFYIIGILFIANKVGFDFEMRRWPDRPHDVPSTLQPSLNKRTPKRLVTDVNCAAILDGDEAEINRAKELTESSEYTHNFISDREYILLTEQCNSFKRMRGYDNYFASEEEAKFPIAYSILLYKNVEQAERLLRAIYTPQNYYCLNVDADSEQDVHDAVHGIAYCFDNVFVVSRKEYVVYAGFTRLQADLNCMENLLQRGDNWKYFMNLPSQEFPLKTNREIVKILQIYNGANDIEGSFCDRRTEHRYLHRFLGRYLHNKTKPKMIETIQEKEDPPYEITVTKGSAYGIFSREFVHFVINNKIARELLHWCRDVLSPEEFYWSTLYFNYHIGTPGSYYRGKPNEKPNLAVAVSWKTWGQPCHGKFVRGICVFGVGDLKYLAGKKNLFANKFYHDYQPYALDCMEEWHFNRTGEGSLKNLNISFYESLPFINRNTGNDIQNP